MYVCVVLDLLTGVDRDIFFVTYKDGLVDQESACLVYLLSLNTIYQLLH